MTKLSEYSNQAYALLRIMAGFMFSFHGIQKIFGVMTDRQPEVFSQLWIGGVLPVPLEIPVQRSVLPCGQPRRARGPLLLCLSLHGHPGRCDVVHRRARRGVVGQNSQPSEVTSP